MVIKYGEKVKKKSGVPCKYIFLVKIANWNRYECFYILIIIR